MEQKLLWGNCYTVRAMIQEALDEGWLVVTMTYDSGFNQLYAIVQRVKK